MDEWGPYERAAPGTRLGYRQYRQAVRFLRPSGQSSGYMVYGVFTNGLSLCMGVSVLSVWPALTLASLSASHFRQCDEFCRSKFLLDILAKYDNRIAPNFDSGERPAPVGTNRPGPDRGGGAEQYPGPIRKLPCQLNMGEGAGPKIGAPTAPPFRRFCAMCAATRAREAILVSTSMRIAIVVRSIPLNCK